MLDVYYTKMFRLVYIYAFAARTYTLCKAEGHVSKTKTECMHMCTTDLACLASYRLGATTTWAD
jgi:hypothetical protein